MFLMQISMTIFRPHQQLQLTIIKNHLCVVIWSNNKSQNSLLNFFKSLAKTKYFNRKFNAVSKR